MSRRHFVELPIREEGQVVPRYRLTCGSCGCGESLGRMNFRPSLADEQVPTKFEDKGWHVGKRHDGRDDRCPACVNREQEARRRRAVANHTEEKPSVSKPIEINLKALPAIASAETPREMTRDERRRIISKVMEVHLSETAGYSAGWTDVRVADELRVPRAWVVKLREENFGPGTSEEVTKLMSEAADLTTVWGELCQEQESIRTRIAETQKRVDALDRAARRIEAAIR